MTNVAAGAQFDFNVLFVIALPVLLGVWIYMIYAFVMWRASRGGPEPVGGPGRTGALRHSAGLDPDHLRHRAVPRRLRYLRARAAGWRRRRRGLQPDLDADVEDHPPDSGHRPAVEIHLPLPDLRRIRDRPTGRPRPHEHRVQRHVARRDPQLLGLPARGEGRRQPRLQQRRLRHAPAAGVLHRAVRRALRDLARRHVQLGRRGDPAAVRVLGQAHRGQAAQEHQAAAAVRPDLHPRRQRRRRRLLPGQRPVFEG